MVQPQVNKVQQSNSKFSLVLILVLLFLYFFLLWRLVHGWIFVLGFLGLLNIWAVLAYRKDISLPFAETILAKEYLRVKDGLIAFSLWKTPKGKIWLTWSKAFSLLVGQAYKDILKYLLLLFLNSEKSFDLFIGIKFDANKQTLAIKTKRVKQGYTQEFLNFHKNQKKKAVFWSLGVSASVTSAIILVAVVLPSLHNLNAMTYGWTQTDWSGGAFLSAIASHPGDKTTWNKYYSTSDNLAIGTEITATGASTSTADNLDANFQTGATVNSYVAGGKVVMLKPTGAICSVGTECVGGACLGGVCFECGVDTVAGEGGPYDANGTTQISGGYYRTVLVGNQCWFKDNLNTGTMVNGGVRSDDTIIEKWCYNNDANNCATDGALYAWNEAMDLPAAYTYSFSLSNFIGSGITAKRQGACPTGWHIPSDYEWSVLEYGLDSAIPNPYSPNQPQTCSSTNHSWYTDMNCGNLTLSYSLRGTGGTGVNYSNAGAGHRLRVGGDSGFEVKPSGIVSATVSIFQYRNNYAYLWTSSRYPFEPRSWARGYYYSPADSRSERVTRAGSNGYSVRCLAD